MGEFGDKFRSWRVVDDGKVAFLKREPREVILPAEKRRKSRIKSLEIDKESHLEIFGHVLHEADLGDATPRLLCSLCNKSLEPAA